MKKFSIRLLVCVVAGVFAFTSCLKDDNDYVPMPEGYMVFVNAFPEASGVIYNLDGRNINGYVPTPFQSYVGSRLFVGKRNLRIGSADENKVLIDSNITVKDTTAYTSFVYGTKELPKFAMTTDKGIENLGDKFGVRYFNFANGTGETNLFLGDATEPLFAKRPIETGATVVANEAFQATASGTIKLTVKDNAGTTLATRGDFVFQKGRYYTIILTGKKDDTKTPLYIGVVAVQ
ncbi:hypothetical protein [Sphingobacterium psychroaquaticum]|uniref:Uncharacterized protein n=1 Tax=Sphingobacterium psychroaquaticum TaxID=561061 RepID=A0A1X7JNB6_9SPHI|nr:hypothetical protein [Sphingobacterium psychroaquaticum]QBQ40827.1 hypothetical protein E2P86_06545 [Sphingobacterium psychroaquaticum]SMG29139.1 hypothetical protein SAMN05660862_1883 [Sphingobacterium psychroaquaticum]